jgi:SAM-dependent methyltransferase
MLESTGERLVPAASYGELVHAEHVARYLLAARLTGGGRVLDAACGEGYGSAMLAAGGAASVVGVDIDPATVEHARESYGLDFRVADVAKLPFADGVFDLVVSFETIEHVSEPERALDEMARVLAEDGLLLISTPNVSEYLVDNPFHVHEFEAEEFTQALDARFAHVGLLYQQNFITSAIFHSHQLSPSNSSQSFALDVANLASITTDRALYLLALCGRRELPELTGNVAALAGIYEAHALASRATEAERLLGEWTKRASRAEHNQDEWEARASRAEHNQREWEARAREAERQNAALRHTLDSTAWRLIQPLRRVGAAIRGPRD